MYVETMTLGEIAKEIMKDKYYLVSKIGYELESQKYRKECLKLKDKAFHSFKRVDFTSKETGLEYHLIPYVFGKRDYLKNSAGFSLFVTFRKYNQLWTGFLYDYGTKVLFFTSHFFDRYEEREGQSSTGRLDLMTGFFTRNRAFCTFDYTHPDHPNSMFVSLVEGVGLGTKIEGSFVLVKTYVSNDMLYAGQANAQLVGLGMIEECYKNFAKGADYSIKAA